jgi:hypothetical protein
MMYALPRSTLVDFDIFVVTNIGFFLLNRCAISATTYTERATSLPPVQPTPSQRELTT